MNIQRQDQEERYCRVSAGGFRRISILPSQRRGHARIAVRRADDHMVCVDDRKFGSESFENGFLGRADQMFADITRNLPSVAIRR
jgi:hypothetical protein